jgi:hypothetical protein
VTTTIIPHSPTRTRATGRTPKTNTKKAIGANPKLAKIVKSINIQQYRKRGSTTFCNQAFNAIARKMGVKNMGGLVANQMFKKMAKPGSGWKKVSAADAIKFAKAGKLVAAAWYNNKPRAGRPDGRAPGHIAAVIGEWSKGVPGIAQAGSVTKEWMSVKGTRPNPTYFVRA